MSRKRRSGATRIITPLTRTVKRPYTSYPEDAAVPGWDREAGMHQHSRRQAARKPDEIADDYFDDHPGVDDLHPKI